MAGQYDFPVMFTIDGSNRHEVIVINPGHDLNQIKQAMEALILTSPNAAEILHKFRSKEKQESIKEVRVKWWSSQNMERAYWPRDTILTEENCEPVLRMMAVGVGRDMLDVKMESKKV